MAVALIDGEPVNIDELALLPVDAGADLQVSDTLKSVRGFWGGCEDPTHTECHDCGPASTVMVPPKVPSNANRAQGVDSFKPGEWSALPPIQSVGEVFGTIHPISFCIADIINKLPFLSNWKYYEVPRPKR